MRIDKISQELLGLLPKENQDDLIKELILITMEEAWFAYRARYEACLGTMKMMGIDETRARELIAEVNEGLEQGFENMSCMTNGQIDLNKCSI